MKFWYDTDMHFLNIFTNIDHTFFYDLKLILLNGVLSTATTIKDNKNIWLIIDFWTICWTMG